MASGFNAGGFAQGFSQAADPFLKLRAQQQEEAIKAETIKIAREKMGAEAIEKLRKAYVEQAKTWEGAIEKSATPEDAEALVGQWEKAQSQRGIASSLEVIGQQDLTPVLRAAARRIQTPEQKGKAAGIEAGAKAQAFTPPKIEVINTDKGPSIAFIDPVTQTVTKQISAGGPGFELGRFRANLALRIENRITGDQQIDSFAPQEAARVLENLGSTDFISQLLRGVTGQPGAKAKVPQAAGAQAPAGGPRATVLLDDGLQRAMQLTAQGSLSVTEFDELVDLLGRATPEQRASIKAIKAKTQQPQAPVR